MMANKDSEAMLSMNMPIEVPLVRGGDEELMCHLLIHGTFRGHLLSIYTPCSLQTKSWQEAKKYKQFRKTI